MEGEYLVARLGYHCHAYVNCTYTQDVRKSKEKDQSQVYCQELLFNIILKLKKTCTSKQYTLTYKYTIMKQCDIYALLWFLDNMQVYTAEVII